MPAGDAQRAWFPEMLKSLESSWNADLSWQESAQLCKKFTLQRTQLKARRGIKNPKMLCKNCGGHHEMTPPPISIRSMLFALKKIDLIDDDQFIELDKNWQSYRRKHKLDTTGQPASKTSDKSCKNSN